MKRISTEKLIGYIKDNIKCSNKGIKEALRGKDYQLAYEYEVEKSVYESMLTVIINEDGIEEDIWEEEE